MPGTSPYRSLEPETWRNLMALAAIFHATRAKLARLCDMAEQTRSVAAVLDQLALAARDISAEDEDDDGIVSRVVTAWDADITAALRRQGLEPEARQLLTQLRDLVQSTVASDPFRLLFEGIQARVGQLYGDAWRPAVLSVAHARSHPRGPTADAQRDPYTVTALTPWSPNAAEAEIELHVYCDQFGPAAFASVPMLLIHECVCHVPARQDKAKNDSAFAEGFLDWVAYYFLDQWASQLDPDLAPAARHHAGRLKYVLTSQTPGNESAARRRGHEAAETLFAWFEGECGMLHAESEMRVARLAIELNQVDHSIELKDHFVSKLERPLPPDLADALQAWVSGEMTAEQLLSSSSATFLART
jgi:hypothetical protein